MIDLHSVVFRTRKDEQLEQILKIIIRVVESPNKDIRKQANDLIKPMFMEYSPFDRRIIFDYWKSQYEKAIMLVLEYNTL